MSSPQNVWFMVGASVVGLVGAVGIMIIEKLRQKREEQILKQHIECLGKEMQNIRKELDTLRNIQKNTSKRSKRSKTSTASTTSTDSFISATDGDSSDLEFYDVSDEEEKISDALEDTHRFADRVDLVLDSSNIEDLKITLEELKDLSEEFPEDANILWRIAKACYKLATDSDNLIDKEEYLRQGIEACKSALRISPNNCDIHKWYAILVGSRAEIQPIKERIADGHLFKKHVDKALTLNPKDYMLHHMLGRFAYEIASLKWYERKVAATLFGEPPSATYEEALNCFLQVEKYCNREWKENKFFIAKCHFVLGQKSEAIKWFKNAEAVPSQNYSDHKLQLEILDMLKKCQS
ncbi:regulator of microtubule dynamics protein 1 [Agrilus planipennis]|uniref:Regulator of microtubule dynamics protein 1 n=1 Tax=Agrilus planipennis TaxID=224129 RepID=A0A1W4XJ20_AGRPL|nr:regulator of microtubule dynamics protein 1 [Agrilus planipennis]